jgi:deoxyadenosine/deoxycytidine kinase
MQDRSVPFRVEICGGIASGKTTFATLFESVAAVVYEDFRAVPFWQHFYAAPNLHSFETELSFLLQHYHQVKQRTLHSSDFVFCDFSFWLDAAYAGVSLAKGKLEAFRAVWDQVILEIGPPQLIIRLECSPETEMRRIQARAREPETRTDIKFLESLNTAILSELSPSERQVPVLIVDSNNEDFALDSAVKDRWRRTVHAHILRLAGSTTELGRA